MRVLIEVPLHLTGFFYPIYTGDPQTTGSLGAGVVITPGLTCSVRKGLKGVTFNGGVMESGPASIIYRVLRLREPLGIELQGHCVPGAGYAFSAASALAVGSMLVASGIAEPIEVARVAHVLEVKHETGLGDILAIWEGGGLTVRTKAGAPGIGRAESVKVDEKVVVLTTELGTMSTSTYLSKHSEKIIGLGRRLHEHFIKDPSLALFLELSESFSKELGLVEEKVHDVMQKLSRRILG
jgi:pantoate kinase